jgi:hypothetical protein
VLLDSLMSLYEGDWPAACCGLCQLGLDPRVAAGRLHVVIARFIFISGRLEWHSINSMLVQIDAV